MSNVVSEREEKDSAIDWNFGDRGDAEIGDVVGKEGEQKMRAHKGEQDSGGAADRGHKQALGNELLKQPQARRSEGQADGDLLLALGVAGEGESRSVGAGYEQHQHSRAHKNEERLANVSVKLLAKWDENDAIAAVGVGMRSGGLRFDGIEFLLRLFQSDARLETREYADVGVIEVVEGRRGHGSRRPYLDRGRIVEFGRHHAEHGTRSAVEGDGFTDDGGIGVKGGAPRWSLRSGHDWAARLVFLDGVETPYLWLHTENVEVAGRYSVTD